MLLRRITKHVSDQNWFAVFLDFVIVVVGVFIGIQVANWNEERKTAIQDKQLIVRLINDLKGMQKTYKDDHNNIRRIHDGWVQIFRSLEKCKALPTGDSEINYALANYQLTAPADIESTAYEEMKAVGAFSRLSNVELQNQISSLYSLLDGQFEARSTGRANHLAAGRILWKSIAFSFSSDLPDESSVDSSIIADFDSLAHCENLELRGAVWELVDVNRDWLIMTKMNDAKIKTLTKKLEEIN